MWPFKKKQPKPIAGTPANYATNRERAQAYRASVSGYVQPGPSTSATDMNWMTSPAAYPYFFGGTEIGSSPSDSSSSWSTSYDSGSSYDSSSSSSSDFSGGGGDCGGGGSDGSW